MSSTRGSSLPIFLDNEKFNGTNWITWRENVTITVQMREAYGYLIGTIKRPVPITTTFTTSTVTDTKSTSPQTVISAPTATISALNEIETKWQSLIPLEEEWDSHDNWVRGLLLYNIKNPIGLGIKTMYHKWSLTICDGCFDTLKSSKM